MSKRRKARIHGVLGIDKGLGVTSRDVVNQVGRLLAERRCGHAGTLDPDASGVLVVAFGEATKTVRWLMSGTKTYEAEVRFGAATLTDDAAGEVIATAPVPDALPALLASALADMQRGSVDQVPPAVSALRQDGVRDHERVRRGERIVRQAREVDFYGAHLLSIEGPVARVVIDCGPGFYVRAWARDLGEQLGSAAHLTGLRRTRSSGVQVLQAHTLEALEAMDLPTREAQLVGVGQALTSALPVVEVDAAVALELSQGKRPPAPAGAQGELLVRQADNGRLVCVAQVRADPDVQGGARLKVVRGFDPAIALR